MRDNDNKTTKLVVSSKAFTVGNTLIFYKLFKVYDDLTLLSI